MSEFFDLSGMGEALEQGLSFGTTSYGHEGERRSHYARQDDPTAAIWAKANEGQAKRAGWVQGTDGAWRPPAGTRRGRRGRRNLSGLGAPMYIFPDPNKPPAGTNTSSGPSIFTDWTKAIFGAATEGASTFNQITGKPTRQPSGPTRRGDNTIMYVIGGAAVLGLGYFLLKGKGKRK